MEKRAELAFREAVDEVISEHARIRLPLYIGRNGKVVKFLSTKVRGLSRIQPSQVIPPPCVFSCQQTILLNPLVPDTQKGAGRRDTEKLLTQMQTVSERFLRAEAPYNRKKNLHCAG